MEKVEPMYYVQSVDEYNEGCHAYWHVGEHLVHPRIERASKFTKKEALSICKNYEAVAFPCSLIDWLKDESKDVVLLKNLHQPILNNNK